MAISGQVTTTNAMVPLPSSPIVVNVTLTALSTNVGNIAVQFYTLTLPTNAYVLEPGKSITVIVSDLSQISIGASSGKVLSYIGS